MFSRTSSLRWYYKYRLLASCFAFFAQRLRGCRSLSSGPIEKGGTASSWRPLPHVFDRRALIVVSSGAALTTATVSGRGPIASAATTDREKDGDGRYRSVASVDSHPVIPVWPSWGGGRVVPVSWADGTMVNDNDDDASATADPFLLLAHHKHWFDPRDPLREPFKAAGKALGLPYVDVEGFSMHPHRGIDILTYVLDGSDGFRHRDSLGGSRTYRGGCAQWMRTGSGVMHEEFWETRDDRRTAVELFQIWVNLPAAQKFDLPTVRYVGTSTDSPWIEETLPTGVRVRDVGRTLEASLATPAGGDGDGNRGGVLPRPPVQILHVRIPAGAVWETSSVPKKHSAVVYVREGAATLDNEQSTIVRALQSAAFHPDGDALRLRNAGRSTLDLLLLAGEPLRELVALGGPIVMNTQRELNDAYRQLSDGTFLDRDVALRQHAMTERRTRVEM